MPQISNLFQIWGILIFCILGLTTCVICVCGSLVLSLSLSLTNSLKFLKICSPGKVMMLCHIFVFVCSFVVATYFDFVCNRKTKGSSKVFPVFMRQTSTLSLFNSFLLGVHSQSICGLAKPEATGFSRLRASPAVLRM